jgi:hypothetical protein
MSREKFSLMSIRSTVMCSAFGGSARVGRDDPSPLAQAA